MFVFGFWGYFNFLVDDFVVNDWGGCFFKDLFSFNDVFVWNEPSLFISFIDLDYFLEAMFSDVFMHIVDSPLSSGELHSYYYIFYKGQSDAYHWQPTSLHTSFS